MNDEYMRVEFSMAAVSRDDYADLQKDLISLRNRYCRGGSTVGISDVRPGTVIDA